MFQPAPTEYSGSSMRSLFFQDNLRSTKYALQKDFKHFQYVNPKLVFEWEGTTKSKLISGEGTFKAYQQSHDGIKKQKKLVFSLQAQNWRQNKPEGHIVMTHYTFFAPTKPDSVVREIRRYSGKCKNLKREGPAEYIIELHYSNQNKDVYEISGQWMADYLISGKISKNGGPQNDLTVFKNIENNNPRRHSISGIAKPLLKPIKSKQKISSFCSLISAPQEQNKNSKGENKENHNQQAHQQFEVKVQKVNKIKEKKIEKQNTMEEEKSLKNLENDQKIKPALKKERQTENTPIKRKESIDNQKKYAPDNYLSVPSQNRKVKHRTPDQSTSKK